MNRTFGEFLKQVATSRKISASQLADLAQLRSKTTIVRLMNNQSSKKAVENFAKKLPELIKLTDKEIMELQEIISDTSVSPAEERVYKNLKLLFCDTPNVFSNSICTAYNSEEKIEKMSLHNIFSICIDKKSTIIIEDAISVELVFALNNLIHQTTENGLSPDIIHFFKGDDGIEAKGMQLLSVMKLSTYLGYSAYECKRSSNLTKKILILTEENKSHNMRLVQFTDNNKFYYIDTPISEVFYQHICYEKSLNKTNAVPLRSEPLNRNQLIEMMEILKEYDKLPSLQINASISYMMIPFEFQCRLFAESNYIGLGRNHPYIQKLYTLLEERANFLASCGIPRKFIWTKNGLKSFMKTGKTGDHFEPFGALSPEECKQTLEYVMNNKGSDFKILRDDYRVFDTEFLVSENNCVNIYDPIWGWWDGFNSAAIADKQIIKLTTNFYNNELWEKHCYSAEESKEIIEEIIRDGII